MVINLLEKYPDKIPVLLKLKALEMKILANKDMSIAEFICFVRKRIDYDSKKAIFLQVKDTLPPLSEFMYTVHERFKESNGTLIMNFNSEDTFG